MARQEHTSPIGELVYGNLIEPEPNLSQKLAWQGGLKLENDQLGPILEALDRCIVEESARNPKFPNDAEKLQLPIKVSTDKNPDDPDGDRIPSTTHSLVKFQRKLEYTAQKTGKVMQRSAPVIYDAKGTVVNGQIEELPWGSTGRFYFICKAYIYNGKPGVTLGLEGFQIATLGESSTREVEAITGGWVAPASDEVSMVESLAGAFEPD